MYMAEYHCSFIIEKGDPGKDGEPGPRVSSSSDYQRIANEKLYFVQHTFRRGILAHLLLLPPAKRAAFTFLEMILLFNLYVNIMCLQLQWEAQFYCLLLDAVLSSATR